MRRTRRTVSRPTLMALLGAVLYGCAFFAPAVGAADGIAVQIIKPDRDPFAFDVDREYEFEAVAFIEGTELPGGEVTWDWDFGDETDHSTDNPALHTYAARGSYTVIVTASYGGMSGQDTLNAKAVAPGTGDLFMGLRLIARGGLGHNFGGTVCDQVEIAVRAPIPAPPDWAPPFTAQFYHNLSAIGGPVGNTGEQEGGTSYSVAVCPQVWPSAAGPNGVAHQWTAYVTVRVGEPPPFGYDEYWSVTGDFTPDNLVITAGGPLVIEHKQGDEKHTLTWNSHHLESEDAGVSPTYYATVEVYGMSGALVTSSGSLPYTINQSGSWDWYPGFGQGDSDGLYAFRVLADHDPLDDDTDKVDMLASIHIVVPLAIDWDTLTLKGKIGYTAAETSSPVLHIYGPSPTEIALSTAAGYHEVEYEVPIGYGTFLGVITATQTADQAAYNRDSVAKPAIPEGCWLGAIPGPPQAVEIIEPNGTPRSDLKFFFDTYDDCLVGHNPTGTDSESEAIGSATGTVVDFPLYNPGLSWTLTPVDGCTLTSIPSPARGAAVKFKYHNLPPSNASFGVKSVLLTLTLPLCTATDSQDVEIYYLANGKSHPGTGSGHTPNWFYYWKEGGVVDGIDACEWYDLQDLAYGYTDEEGVLGPAGRIYLGNHAPTFKPGGDRPSPFYIMNKVYPEAEICVGILANGWGVYSCRLTILHEQKHLEYWSMRDNGAVDGDLDGVPDSVEDATCVPGGLWLSRTNPDTYGLHAAMPGVPSTKGDNEFMAYREEWLAARDGRVASGADAHKDWRVGGHNWTEFYDYINGP